MVNLRQLIIQTIDLKNFSKFPSRSKSKAILKKSTPQKINYIFPTLESYNNFKDKKKLNAIIIANLGWYCLVEVLPRMDSDKEAFDLQYTLSYIF